MKGVHEHTKKECTLTYYHAKHIFRKESVSFVGKYIACHGKCFFRLTIVASDQLPVPKTPLNNSLSISLTLLNGLLWSYFTVFLWMVGLEVIKQVRCVSQVCKGTIANPKKKKQLVSCQ